MHYLCPLHENGELMLHVYGIRGLSSVEILFSRNNITLTFTLHVSEAELVLEWNSAPHMYRKTRSGNVPDHCINTCIIC